ncbi:MAG: DUF898 family protein [Pseudomonadota bacterium]
MNLASSGQVEYSGETGPLFKIALANAVLTLLTLGIYRFWARTRERKYMWSAIRADGSHLEYSGNGLEKFLGFLIAVAFLAVYLGVFQLLLTFLGYSFFEEDAQLGLIPGLGFSLAPLIILPLIFYAQYRARRYVLSRTRWRGIRFGAEKAAWRYVGVALWNLFLTVITLGILYPRMVFKLEEFRTNHSYYGDAKLHQGGRWPMLYKAARQFFIGLGLLILGILLTIIGEVQGASTLTGAGGVLFFVANFWIIIGGMAFGVNAWRMMANEKRLGEVVTFTSTVKTSEVVGRYIGGFILIGVIVSIFVGVAALLFGGLVSAFDPADPDFGQTTGAIGLVGFIVLYLGVLISVSVLTLVWITQPILEKYVTTLTINNAQALNDISQREGDDFVEAEGFADALDVGAAI